MGEDDWARLRCRKLMDPDLVCTMELWLEDNPVLVGAFSTDASMRQDSGCTPLTELLADMHTKEKKFLKEIVEDDSLNDLQLEDLPALYDSMNKQCGWDKWSVMIHVSNGDEIVRVCRAAFLFALHDRYLFGNTLQLPKLILSEDGMMGMPMEEEQELDVGSMVKDSVVGERVLVEGLISAAQHNGKEGVVNEYIVDTGRFKVSLDSGEALAVKNSNMRLATEARANLTPEDKQHIMGMKLSIFENPALVTEVLANLPNMTLPSP